MVKELLCCITTPAPEVLQQQGLTHLPSASLVVLLQQVEPDWAGYDLRVEAMLSIDAAVVMESLLRTTTRMPAQPKEYLVMKAQVRSSVEGSDVYHVTNRVM